MKASLALILSIAFVLNAKAQIIDYVKDSVMNQYMESGFSNKKFRPHGKTDKHGLRQGVWKDYEVTSDQGYCMLNNMPEQIGGEFLLYGEGVFTDSLRNGIWTFYTIEDKTFKHIIHKKVAYERGILNGHFEYYYSGGEIAMKGDYNNGKWNGKVASYYPDGKPYGTLKFINGNKNGTHIYKYQNGQIKLEHTFKNGIKDSLYVSYYRNGNIREKLYYKSGIEDGTYQYYYENGQLWTEGKYVSGKLMEVIANYSANGDSRDKGTISNGNGTVKFYNENGQLYNVKTFEDGTQIKEEKLGLGFGEN